MILCFPSIYFFSFINYFWVFFLSVSFLIFIKFFFQFSIFFQFISILHFLIFNSSWVLYSQSLVGEYLICLEWRLTVFFCFMIIFLLVSTLLSLPDGFSWSTFAFQFWGPGTTPQDISQQHTNYFKLKWFGMCRSGSSALTLLCLSKFRK